MESETLKELRELLMEYQSEIKELKANISELKENMECAKEGTLKFKVTDGFGEANFRRAVNADDAYGALHDITQKLRSLCKYELDGDTYRFCHADCEVIDLNKEGVREAIYEFAEGVRADIWEIISDQHGINFDKDYC